MSRHILHIPRWYPYKGDAMLGLFVKNQLQSLGKEYLNSVLFIHFVENQDDIYSIQTDPDDLIKTYNCYVKKSTTSSVFLNNLINACRYFKASLKVFKLIREHLGKPQLCHVHVLTRSGLPALWLKWIHGIPYVVSEHWSRYFPEHNAFKGRLRKCLARLIVKRSSALICVSESLHQALKDHDLDHKNYYTIPNSVDSELFVPAINKTSSDVVRLIHISCFEDKSKNISGLLRAMKVLNVKNAACELTLIGDGIDKDNLQELASDLGLNGIVRFSGVLSPVELVKQLQQADFLVQTSHYETFSTVVAESFACGIPVISTPVGIFPEVLEPDTGVLIPSGSPDDIANAISQAITRKDIFNREKIRQIAISRFSKQRVGDLMMSCYQLLIPDAKA